MFVSADHVPVCDQPHEPGIPGRERPTAPAHTLPKRKTRQEKHRAMRRRFFYPQQTVIIGTAQNCVYVNSPTACPVFYIAHVWSLFSALIDKRRTKQAAPF